MVQLTFFILICLFEFIVIFIKWGNVSDAHEITKIISSIPESLISCTIYCIAGLSAKGKNSLDKTFDNGKNLVPSPATGIIAFFTSFFSSINLVFVIASDSEVIS